MCRRACLTSAVGSLIQPSSIPLVWAPREIFRPIIYLLTLQTATQTSFRKTRIQGRSCGERCEHPSSRQQFDKLNKPKRQFSCLFSKSVPTAIDWRIQCAYLTWACEWWRHLFSVALSTLNFSYIRVFFRMSKCKHVLDLFVIDLW